MKAKYRSRYLVKPKKRLDRDEWFVKNLVGGVDQGQVSFYMRHWGSSKMKLVRQDYVGKTEQDHKIEDPRDYFCGRTYQSWTSLINSYARNSHVELFYTPNTFYGKPCEENLCSLRTCFIDIDCHKTSFFGTRETKPVILHLASELQQVFFFDSFPIKPTIVNSGRGLHLMFRIESERPDKLDIWRRVQRELAEYVADKLQEIPVPEGLRFDVDYNALNPARILRVPGSYNGRAGSWSRIVYFSSDKGSLGDFIEYFSMDENVKQRYYANTYMNRESALMEVGNMRDWEMTGLRHVYLTIFASDLVNLGYEEDAIREELYKINCMFTESLRERELDYITRACVSHKYHYSNRGIIDYLGLDEGEAALFPIDYTTAATPAMRGYLAVMSGKRDTRIRNKARNKMYKNRKDNKFQNYIQFAMLRKQGYSADDIAMRFSVSVRTVKTYWTMGPAEIYEKLYHETMAKADEIAAFSFLASIRKKKKALTERARLYIRASKKDNNLGKFLKKAIGVQVIRKIQKNSEKSFLELVLERILGPCKNCAIT